MTDRIVPTDLQRGEFIYGKDKLVEDVNDRVDISLRQLTGKRKEK